MSTRKNIRDNIVTALTGLTTTGSNVFRSRVYPLDQSSLPGLCIFTQSDDAEYQTIGTSRTVRHLLTVSVEAYVRQSANYDNTLDTIQDEVDAALAVDRTRGGYAQDTRIVAFTSTMSADGDQPLAVGEMSLEIDYVETEG